MKILHLIRGLANSSGTTHIVGPLAEAQSRLGHDVRVLTVEKAGEAPVLPDPKLVESKVFPMTIRSRHFGWSRQYAQALDVFLEDADVVHIHAIWNFVSWRGMKSANRAGIPYFVAPQGSLEDWALGRSRHAKALYARLTEKPLFDHATAMQALTQAEEAQCQRFGIKAPARILPNGVDLDLIDQIKGRENLQERANLPGQGRILLFLSRIFPKKGLDLLLDGFSRALTDDVYLVIAGHDAGTGYQSDIEDRAQSLGIADRVRFIGEVRGDEKFRVLRGADAFALTSYSEGLPVAVVEAMACSLPVLITPGCNFPDVEKRGAGWLVDPDAEAVASGIRSVFVDLEEARKRGSKARQWVEEEFTWPRIAERSVEIYEELIK